MIPLFIDVSRVNHIYIKKKTGSKQQNTYSFDKHFEKNLSKNCISELGN